MGQVLGKNGKRASRTEASSKRTWLARGNGLTVGDRYFFRIDRDEKPSALFRLREPFIPEIWLNSQWSPSERLLQYLQDGFVDLDEVSESKAKLLWPDAFESEK